jgi:hypothetical protein
MNSASFENVAVSNAGDQKWRALSAAAKYVATDRLGCVKIAQSIAESKRAEEVLAWR